MKIFLSCAVLALLSVVAIPALAHDVVHGQYSGFKKEPHWGYGAHPTQAHNNQWRDDDWVTSDWAGTPADARQFLKDLTATGVLSDYRRSFDRARSGVLWVGDGFHRLSGLDQRRVLAIFDQVHGVTKLGSRTLFLRDDRTGKLIGLYTALGYQRQ